MASREAETRNFLGVPVYESGCIAKSHVLPLRYALVGLALAMVWR